jgi:anti-sigma B factor antagonist
MEVTTREVKEVEVIAVKGRVDSAEAPRFAQALEAAFHRGRYRIVVDMSQLEYMSSAGFRALGDAQRNSKRHPPGEVIMAAVPPQIHEALETVGFTESFRIMDTLASALEFAAKSVPAE